LNVKEAITNRMSIRSFTKGEVSNEMILEILRAGNCAPTAGNIQPWEFIIVREHLTKKEIVNTTFLGKDEQKGIPQKWMLLAPIFIVICADVDRSYNKYGEKSLKTLIYLDCSACIENMLITIVDLNLGSCYVSGFREKELSQILKLPANVIPIGILPVGYPNGMSIKRPKIDVESKIHYEWYNKK